MQPEVSAPKTYIEMLAHQESTSKKGMYVWGMLNIIAILIFICAM